MAIAMKIAGHISKSSWIRRMFEEGERLRQENRVGWRRLLTVNIDNDAIGIVQFGRTVEAKADTEALGGQKLTPFFI